MKKTWTPYAATALAVFALGAGIRGWEGLAQGTAQLPPELNNAYIRDLAAKARAEGGVINTYGMPNDWANYGKSSPSSSASSVSASRTLTWGVPWFWPECVKRRPVRTTSPTSSLPLP